MLDLKFIRSHLEEVKQALINRGQEFLLDDFESLDEMRRLLLGRWSPGGRSVMPCRKRWAG